jgi:hypothetical protein
MEDSSKISNKPDGKMIEQKIMEKVNEIAGSKKFKKVDDKDRGFSILSLI